MLRRLLAIATCTIGLGALHCSKSDDGAPRPPPLPRSWTEHPAVVEIDDDVDVYAVSDVHGAYDMFVGLLATNRLVDAASSDPAKPRWAGGKAVLVVAGDMLDKGAESVEVVDLLRSLQSDAARSGGRVVVTMGNHEAEFMLDPHNKKASRTAQDEVGVDVELEADGVAPDDVARAADAAGRGAWIAALPFAARVRDWFFAHAGATGGLSVAALSAKLSAAYDRDGFGAGDLTGGGSILEAQSWYGDPSDPDAGRSDAAALGVTHVAFGHDPGAFGEHGRMRASDDGILVKLDTAMGRALPSGGVGRAFLLHVPPRGGAPTILDDAGSATPL